MKSLLFIWCCFISVGVFGQTPKAIEADLLKLFRGINTNSSDVDKANTEFSRKLIYYAEKYPASIKWPFESLKKENLNISTSSDNMLRIYSWDTWSGGTMHYFESVFQYKVADKTKTLSDASKAVVDDRPSYYRLYTFNADGKTYYLAIWRGIGSSKDAETGIHSFTIENKELKRSKIFKTNSGIHDELYYWYDFASVAKIDFEKRPDIHFDNSIKIIFLPLINSKGIVTDKFITYKFTGKYFKKVKN